MCRGCAMEDKLKRYEKVEFLGEGQVIKRPSYAIFNEAGLYYEVLNEFLLHEICSIVVI
jgi:hypothetical protein